MRALAPASASAPWTVSSSGSTNGGELDDVTISIANMAEGGRSSLRSMRRLGAIMGPFGSVHGQVTDATTIAQLAILSLLLEAIPAGLEREQTLARMGKADADSRTLSADRDRWDVVPMPVDGTDYALWTRTVPGGVVAHADLGWATVAMWSASALYAGAYRIAEIGPETRFGL